MFYYNFLQIVTVLLESINQWVNYAWCWHNCSALHALLSAKKVASVLAARSYMHLSRCSYLLKFYTVATEGGGLNHVHMWSLVLLTWLMWSSVMITCATNLAHVIQSYAHTWWSHYSTSMAHVILNHVHAWWSHVLLAIIKTCTNDVP